MADQVRRGDDHYTSVTIELDNARNDEFVAVAGKTIYIEDASSDSALASVKLNRIGADSLNLKKGSSIETVFSGLYLTNTAQAGEWLKVIFGREFKMDSVQGLSQAEAQPIVVITNAAANTNTIPSAQVCDTVLLKADVKNTGIVWVDFGTAAVQDSCLPLDPHESITVKLSNLNQINANFEIADEKLFAVYQV